MGLAPRPGVGDRKATIDAAQTILQIRVKDQTLTLAPNNLSMAERAAVRKQCYGLPFEAYWSGEQAIGLDSIQVMWWLARRAHGEPNLLFRTVEETWPSDLTPDDVDVEEYTPDDEGLDDPES